MKIGKLFVVTLAAVSMMATSVSANTQKVETCEASWYGPGLQGNTMANGRRFDMNDASVVAHKDLPFGTVIRVTNTSNNESVKVVVQDRGPFKKGRCVDLSRAAAQELGMYCGPRCGTAQVKVEVISHP